MLKPIKYSNLNVSLIAISGEIIKIFGPDNALTYTELLNKVLKNKGIEAKKVFLPALSLLFLLGKIRYHKNSDVIEIVK